jgi:hypothetical protein
MPGQELLKGDSPSWLLVPDAPGVWYLALREGGFVITDIREPPPAWKFLEKYPLPACKLPRGDFLLVRSELL